MSRPGVERVGGLVEVVLAIALMVAACTSESADDTTTTPVEPTLPATVEADWLVHTEGPPGTWLAALNRSPISGNMVAQKPS